VHDLPQEVHPWVRAVASYAHSRRGTLQVQVLPQVIRQVGPLPVHIFGVIYLGDLHLVARKVSKFLELAQQRLLTNTAT
jgi:hypothetical protein